MHERWYKQADRVGTDLKGLEMAAYGYRWIRLRETPGR